MRTLIEDTPLVEQDRADFHLVWSRMLRRRGKASELRRVFNRALIPMVWIDNEGHYLDANPASRLFLRRTLAQIQRMAATDLLAPEQHPEFEQLWTTMLQDGTVAGTIPMLAPEGYPIQVDYCGIANLLPGAHLFVWMPSDWPEDELFGAVEEGLAAESGPGKLTDREREVLTLLARGATTTQIAAEMSVSPSTIKTHLRNALRRTGAAHRAQAIAIAARDGEIDLG